MVQGKWIHQGIKNARVQFDGKVYQALKELNEQLQEDEIAVFLEDSLAFGNSNTFRHKVQIHDSIFSSQQDTLRKKRILSGTFGFIGDSSFGTSSINHEMIIVTQEDSDNDEETIEINMSGGPSLSQIELAVDCLEANHNITMIELQDLLNEKSKQIEEVMTRILVRDHLSLETRFPLDSIENHVRKHLKQNGIESDFDYLVQFNYSDEPDRISGDESVLKSSIYYTRLFESRIDRSYADLHVSFPSKFGYIIKEIWGSMLLSALFIFALVGMFGYTINSMIKQRKISDLKNDFVANMTHELKTPITSINLACDTLNEPDFEFEPNSVRNYVSIIAQENERLQSLVNNVLESSFFESDKMDLKKQQVNFVELIESELVHLQLRIESLNGTLNTTFSTEDKILVYADKFHLSNCLRNLFDNAIKYSGNNVKIGLSLISESEHWAFQVSDQGIGIPKVEQDRIFEKFHRVQKGNVHDVKGFGLGLHYVKRIVDLHDGNISVDSKLDVGSTFTLRLPKF